MSRSHYAQIESGDKNPSLNLSLKIKQALGYPYDDHKLTPSDPYTEKNEKRKSKKQQDTRKKETKMNSLVIILIAMVVLVAGYVFYGRWLAKKWGIDEKAKTPAFTHEDGEDFVPSSKFTVFSHQFSSIAGAGPVTGPILASVFGWVPVLLWLLIGGLFFGAVQDFGALYASVKNEGKSMGMIIEKYIGKTGRKLFMLFCWLFTL